ncbi:uncharacterized protein LOC142748183 [Rhinoderma darwinii]|uniref:uncharacterized protein LOC142748183 n=1 Tax=Rhinoderma darwinii TaxID=43563 RepID=UPI003F67F3A5
MGQCPSNVIIGFLDNIHKVLTYDPVTFSFIAWNIIYKLFEWAYSSKNTKKKCALQSKKEINCASCKYKEPSSQLSKSFHKTSSQHNQPLDFQNVQTNMASYSATMKRSFNQCILGGSTSPRNVPKMTAVDTVTTMSTVPDVKTNEITVNMHCVTKSPAYLVIGDDDCDLKLYKMKITNEHQLSILQQIKQLLKLLSPPIPNTNACECQQSEIMKHMAGLEPQRQPISSLKWSVINVSKLRIHFLRKILENIMMAFPKIVQRSVQMYNDSCPIPPKWKDFSVSTEPSMYSNGPEMTPKIRPVPSVGPVCLTLNYDSLMDQIQRSKKTTETTRCDISVVSPKAETTEDSVDIKREPQANSSLNVSQINTDCMAVSNTDQIYDTSTMGYSSNSQASSIGHKSYYKKVASSTNFKRSKRPPRKETNLPISSILHFGMNTVQALSPEVCIDRSHKRIKNTTTSNYKKQDYFQEPVIPKDSEVVRSKIQTKNKMKVIEEQESNEIPIPNTEMPPDVTCHVYSNPLHELHSIPYSLVDDQSASTTMVRGVIYSCSERKTSTPRFHYTDPSKTSTFKFPDVFATFKRFLLKTMEPSYPQRKQRKGRRRKKEPSQKQISL